MTLFEAKKLALIAGNIDGGCPVCIGHFVEDLNEAFPEFVWKYDYDENRDVQVSEASK